MIFVLYGTLALLVVSWLVFLRYIRSSERRHIGYLERKKRNCGYVYAYRGRREAFWRVKIGRAVDPVQRLRSQRTAKAYGLVVVACMRVQNDVVAEKYIHSLFCKQRISPRSEWFYLSPLLYLYLLLVRDKPLTVDLDNRLGNQK